MISILHLRVGSVVAVGFVRLWPCVVVNLFAGWHHVAKLVCVHVSPPYGLLFAAGVNLWHVCEMLLRVSQEVIVTFAGVIASCHGFVINPKGVSVFLHVVHLGSIVSKNRVQVNAFFNFFIAPLRFVDSPKLQSEAWP